MFTLERLYGKERNAALVGRWSIQMQPLGDMWIFFFDWKAGRYPLKCHLHMPGFVCLHCLEGFCEFLIDTDYDSPRR